MKPFDLAKALAGDPVITRDGKPVTQITFFKDAIHDTIAGLLDGYIESWRKDGRYNAMGTNDNDLFMAEKVGWVVVYQGLDGGFYLRQAKVYPTFEEAKRLWPDSTPVQIKLEEEQECPFN